MLFVLEQQTKKKIQEVSTNLASANEIQVASAIWSFISGGFVIIFGGRWGFKYFFSPFFCQLNLLKLKVKQMNLACYGYNPAKRCPETHKGTQRNARLARLDGIGVAVGSGSSLV